MTVLLKLRMIRLFKLRLMIVDMQLRETIEGEIRFCNFCFADDFAGFIEFQVFRKYGR
jgi:hypothetical protein